MADIRMQKVNKTFGKVQVIHDVDLQIDSGDFCVFVGPSGCGKSTLLRLVAGLEEISGGDLYIGGDQVNDKPPSRQLIGVRRSIRTILGFSPLPRRRSARTRCGVGTRAPAPRWG